MKYFKYIPLEEKVEGIIKGKKVTGIIIKKYPNAKENDINDKYLSFCQDERSGSGRIQSPYKYSWSFQISPNGTLTEGVSDIKLINKPMYEIY